MSRAHMKDEAIRERANVEVAKRGGRDPWSEEVR